jgi:hypothetical protein
MLKMVYFDSLHKSLSVFSRNWKIVVPSLFGFLMASAFALIFIYINNLFPLILRDPSGLFVSGGLSAIAKKISSVLITQSHLMKIIISLIAFFVANFFVGSGLIAVKFTMINDVLKGKKVGLVKAFFDSGKYYWRVIEMRVMVFIFIIILSLIVGLPIFILFSSLGGSSFMAAILVILVLLLIRLFLLFRYPILFRDDVGVSPALIKSMGLFKSKTKYVLSVWLIIIGLLFVVSILSEFGRVVIGDLYYGLASLAIILIVFYVIKELILVFVNTFIDIFLFISYLKRRK